MDSRTLKLNQPLVELQFDFLGPLQCLIITDVFSNLPNEMLRAILRRVQARRLIRLRLVNEKFKNVIELILRDKKGLVIVQRSEYNTEPLLEMSKRFNGHVKWSRENFVFIRLTVRMNPRARFHLSGNLCALLAKLFPHIEQFFITGHFSYSSLEFATMLRQWSLTLNTLSLRLTFDSGPFNDLCAPINDLVNLKKFEMTSFPSELITQLTPTFARLEHLSGCTIEDVIRSSPNLGTRITSLGMFGYTSVSVGDLTELNRLYGSFVSSLERFSLYSWNPNYNDALPFICEHFSSLQMLRFDSYCKFTTDMIQHLARLTHLTEFRFESIRIEMAALDVANLVPLHNIRTFSLVDFKFVTGLFEHYCTLLANFDVRQFCQVISTIFPNVENLIIKSPLLANLLEPHLNLFVNLRSHDFGLTDPIDRFVN